MLVVGLVFGHPGFIAFLSSKLDEKPDPSCSKGGWH